MKFKVIACINHANTLGMNNKLLYHIKNDLANFKRITINNVIIMGRKTFESLPSKGLTNRINIVITSDESYKSDGCYVVHSIEECIKLCENEFSNLDCYVIGGGKVYEEFISLDLVDVMYITEVNDTLEGDAFFPNVLMDSDKWKLFYRSDTQYDRETNIKYFFNIYKRNILKNVN